MVVAPTWTKAIVVDSVVVGGVIKIVQNSKSKIRKGRVPNARAAI